VVLIETRAKRCDELLQPILISRRILTVLRNQNSLCYTLRKNQLNGETVGFVLAACRLPPTPPDYYTWDCLEAQGAEQARVAGRVPGPSRV
jgi:hypothetical protein